MFTRLWACGALVFDYGTSCLLPCYTLAACCLAALSFLIGLLAVVILFCWTMQWAVGFNTFTLHGRWI